MTHASPRSSKSYFCARTVEDVEAVSRQLHANGKRFEEDEGMAQTEASLATDGVPGGLLDAKQIAALLKIKNFRKVYRMANAGEIPGFKVGSEWRFIWVDVLASLKERSRYGIEGS